VPQIVRRMSQDPDHGRGYINKLLTATLVLLFALTVIAVLAAPLIADVYGSQRWSLDDRSAAVMFTRYCLPQIICYGVFEMVSQVLNARGRFGAPMFAPILNNLVVIATAIGFAAVAGTKVTTGTVTDGQLALLGIGTTVGVAAQALVLLPVMARSGHLWRLDFKWRGAGLGKALTLARWTFLLVLVNQLGYIVITKLATTANVLAENAKAVAAGFTSYQKAHLLFVLPHGIITVSLVTAIVPLLSKHAHDNKPDSVRTELQRVLRAIATFVVPAAAIIFALGPQIGMVLYGSGASNRDAGQLIGLTLSIFALALPAYSLYYALLRVFYAHEDTRTPFLLTVVLNIVDVALAIPLFHAAPLDLKVPALAAAYVVAYWVTLAVTWSLARRRTGGLATAALSRHFLMTVALSVPAGAVAWWVGDTLADPNLTSWVRAVPLATAVAAALMVVVVIGRIAGIREFQTTWTQITSRLRKR
ncbi:MAG: hypothetical protein RL745_925, partial [Actinomycetota bacterium]